MQKTIIVLIVLMLVAVAVFILPVSQKPQTEKLPTGKPGQYRSIALSDQVLLDQIRSHYSQVQYQASLQQQQSRNRERYEQSDLVERVALDRELVMLKARESDASHRYQKKLQLLVKLIRFLEDNAREFSPDVYNTVQTSLMKGKLEEASKPILILHNKYRITLGGDGFDLAARAAQLRGEIAEENLALQKAYQYFRLSVKYDPENISYLLSAGDAADKLALYKNAIIYYEAALHNMRQQNQASNRALRELLLKLARAWESRANQQKAQEYYRQATVLANQNKQQ